MAIVKNQIVEEAIKYLTNEKNKALILFEMACEELGDIECPVLVLKLSNWECSKERSCDRQKNNPKHCWARYLEERLQFDT